MSFFDKQEYLDSVRKSEDMEVRPSAPPLLLSTSPERRHLLNKLADIPEATPGPNAFAQQASRMDKYRLESNAFYQQEVQKRLATPPTLAHPALRARSMSDPPTPPRMSSCTTLSPFINAGKPEHSPPLKLVPSDDQFAEPTERAYIEEHHEQRLHEQSGKEGGRTPMFISTTTFDQSTCTPKKRAEKQKEVTIAELPVKTPKRSVLEKLRLNTNFRNSPSSIPTAIYTTAPGTEAVDHMPVKAKAVLGGTSPSKKSRTSFGSSPSKSFLPRSPSKRKGLFSRKVSGLGESTTSRSKSALSGETGESGESDHPPLTASTVTKTPPTAFSDPTHYSYSYKTARVFSHPRSDQGSSDIRKCSIARSQSLKYFDHGIPPTPPTKDTPPEEKAKREATKSSRPPFQDQQSTPSKEPMVFVSTSERLSPTKFGSYGHREAPTLVTKPSMYSLHASVVPTLTDASTFEEMKARIDGLGLEGFNMPPENMRTPKQGNMYSPSIYSTDWGVRPNSAFAITPSPLVHNPSGHTKKTSDKSKSSSSGGEIPMVYPELAKDPSYSDITPGAMHAKAIGRGRDHLAVALPMHGCTHSRDHSCESRASRDSFIFAHHVEDDQDKHTSVYGSPTSFSHPSATPSPLQTLPATTYKPPPRKSSRQVLLTPEPASRGLERTGLRIKTQSRTNSTSPSRNNELFTNAPALSASPPRPSSPLRRTASPAVGLRESYTNGDVDVDPQKPPQSRKNDSDATDKIDKVLELLSHLHERNSEITSIRDEMRASNTRLGERLAAVETLQRSSPAPSSEASASGWEDAICRSGVRKVSGRRISTLAAHEFYSAGRAQETTEGEGENYGRSLGDDTEDGVVMQNGEKLDGESGVGQHQAKLQEEDLSPTASDGDGRRSETIEGLREANAKLLEMVTGFAQRIKSLESKEGNGA